MLLRTSLSATRTPYSRRSDDTQLNWRLLDQSEIRTLQLGVLRDFATFCDQHQLRYFLYGGTLLGAIRHQGYIPWDDDVDVAMPRPDYQELISLTERGRMGDFDIELLSPDTDSAYPFPMPKVVDINTVLVESGRLKYRSGVGIDVFVADGLPDDSRASDRMFARYSLYSRLLTLINLDPTRIGSVRKRLLVQGVQLIFKPLKYQWIIARLYEMPRQVPYGTTRFAGIFGSQYGKRGRVTLDTFEAAPSTAVFEEDQFPISEKSHAWLTQIYGDYMRWPPIEKRVSHHAYRAYLRRRANAYCGNEGHQDIQTSPESKENDASSGRGCGEKV